MRALILIGIFLSMPLFSHAGERSEVSPGSPAPAPPPQSSQINTRVSVITESSAETNGREREDLELALKEKKFGVTLKETLMKFDGLQHRTARDISPRPVPNQGEIDKVSSECSLLFINDEGKMGEAGDAVLAAFDRFARLEHRLTEPGPIVNIVKRVCPGFESMTPYQRKTYWAWVLGGISAFEDARCNKDYKRNGKPSGPHALSGLMAMPKKHSVREHVDGCKATDIQPVNENVACALGWLSAGDSGTSLNRESYFSVLRKPMIANAILGSHPLCDRKTAQ